MGRMFENAVYLQLLHEGWQVHVGKLYAKETDFVATKDGRTLYVRRLTRCTPIRRESGRWHPRRNQPASSSAASLFCRTIKETIAMS